MRELPWDFNDPETLVNFNDFYRTGPPGSSPRKNIHDNNDGNFGRTEFPDTFPYPPPTTSRVGVMYSRQPPIPAIASPLKNFAIARKSRPSWRLPVGHATATDQRLKY